MWIKEAIIASFLENNYKISMLNKQDISREGFTKFKLLHTVRTFFNSRLTEVLEAYNEFKDIDINLLKSLGKLGIILDIDECVAPHHGRIFNKNEVKIKKLLNEGFKIVVFSNMKYSNRYKELEDMGVKIIMSKYPKPDSEGFLECLSELGLQASEVVMIGDNYLTDGGAIYAGIDFIKIKPIETGDTEKSLGRKFQVAFRGIADFVAINIHRTLKYK